MLTCFIRTEFYETNQTVTVIIFLLIPISFILYSIFLVFKMCFNKKLTTDSNLLSLFYKYVSYIGVYLIFYGPMFILYVITLTEEIQPGTFLSWLSFVRKKKFNNKKFII